MASIVLEFTQLRLPDVEGLVLSLTVPEVCVNVQRETAADTYAFAALICGRSRSACDQASRNAW
jgi:hypothetical protein